MTTVPDLSPNEEKVVEILDRIGRAYDYLFMARLARTIVAFWVLTALLLAAGFYARYQQAVSDTPDGPVPVVCWLACLCYAAVLLLEFRFELIKEKRS